MRYTACSVPVRMVHCMVKPLNASLTLFQGFLYVFGGMLDSAYSNSRYPLWVFDIGELLCWETSGWQPMTRRAAARLHVRNIQHKKFTKLPEASKSKDARNGNVYRIGLKERYLYHT